MGRALSSLRGRSRHIAEDPAYAGTRVSRAELASESEEEPDEGAEAALHEILGREDSHGADGGAVEEEEEEDSEGGGDEVDEELRQLEAEDAAHLQKLTTHTADERRQGVHARNQQALWEDCVELRIRLQTPLRAADRLPKPDMHAHFREQSAEVDSAMGEAAGEAAKLLDDLVGLRETLFSRHDALAPAVVRDGSSGGGGGAEGRDTELAARWARLQGQDARLRPFRDAVLDRWADRVRGHAAQGAGRAKLRAFNQSVSQQLRGVLAQRERNLKRTRLVRSGTRAVGDPRPGAEAKAEAEADEGGVRGEDAERFDDTDFYEQLLHEFLTSKQGKEAAGAGAPGVPKKRRSVKKSVDRRASKGRKLRYVPHPKLQNFTAAEDLEPPKTDVDELFRSLFRYQ